MVGWYPKPIYDLYTLLVTLIGYWFIFVLCHNVLQFKDSLNEYQPE
jgi:hypothetical protein